MSAHHPRNIGQWATYDRVLRPCDHETEDAISVQFSQNPSDQVSWHVIVDLCHTVSDDVNALLLQHTPNLLNILLIHAGNADAALNLTVTALNNFNLKRDTIQTKDDCPAQ